MDSAFRSTGSFFTVIVIGVLLMTGCESPGSVGSDLTDNRADVVIDTFSVNGISTAEYSWYSGGYSYFSAGRFDDPLFGSLNAVGMLKPLLPGSSDSTIVEADAVMKMRLIINDEQIYGDLSSPQEFDVYPIDELWRGKAWELKDDITFDAAQKVAEFTITDQDSLDVVLDPAWVQTYREFAQSEADSAYKYEEFGLAIVPANSSKILPLNSNSTRFVIETASDTFEVSLAQWAYSFDRGSSTIPSASMPLHSTYESVLNFNLDLSAMDVQGVGISKAELVLYENTSAMESSIPSSAERANAPTAQLYIADPESTPESIAIGSPVVSGSYSEDDNAYHFTVTPILQRILLDGMNENQEFYITFPNNGIIKSSLIYGDQAPAGKAPKLIITSLKNNNS